MGYTFRLTVTILTSLALALVGCGKKKSANPQAATTQAQAQQTINNLQDELKRIQAKLKKTEVYTRSAQDQAMRESQRADMLEDKDRNDDRTMVDMAGEKNRLVRQIEELELAISEWQRRAQSAEIAASELQGAKQRLQEVEAELAEAKDALKRAKRKNRRQDKKEEDTPAESPETDEAPTPPAPPVPPTPPAEEPKTDEPKTDDPTQPEPTPFSAPSQPDDKTPDTQEPPVVTPDTVTPPAADPKTDDPATAEPKADDTTRSEATDICKTVAELEKELAEIEAKATKTEVEEAKADTIKSDIERLIKKNGKECDGTPVTAAEPPAPQRDTAAADEKEKAVKDSLALLKAKKAELDAAEVEVTKLKTELASAAESDKPQVQEKLTAVEAKVAALKGELTPLKEKLTTDLGETADIETDELITKGEKFLADLTGKADSVEKDVATTVTDLGKSREELKAKVSAAAEEVRNSNLSEDTKKLLLDRLGLAFAEIESSPVYLMARLKVGDLKDKTHPFFVTVYGAAKKEDIALIKQTAAESAIAKATGLESNDDSLAFSQRDIENTDKVVFHHRHLLLGTFEELSALIVQLEEKGALVSVKPLDKIEVDTLVSWTPAKEELREKLNLRVLISTKESDIAGLSFEQLNKPAALLGIESECTHFRVECVQKLKSMGLLTQPSAEPTTVAERAYAALAFALDLSKNKSAAPGLVPTANRVVEAGKKVLTMLIGETVLEEYLKEASAESFTIKDIRIESRIWAVQKKSLTEDPLARQSVYDVTRKQLKEGTASFSLTAEQYIVEDSEARYYLLPMAPAAGLPAEFTGEGKAKELVESLSQELK